MSIKNLLLKFKNYFIPDKNKKELFRGKNKLFKQLVKKIDYYSEYGVGLSTLWVMNNTRAKVISADTDIYWINVVKKSLNNNLLKRIKFINCNVGPIRSWGYPKNYNNHKKFDFYFNSIWKIKNFHPQVVLIDGRFRVACFLTCLKKSKQGTKIIFDDYKNRPHYHIVENFIKPKKIYFDQALFVVPSKKKLNIKKINNFILKFKFVMD